MALDQNALSVCKNDVELPNIIEKLEFLDYKISNIYEWRKNSELDVFMSSIYYDEYKGVNAFEQQSIKITSDHLAKLKNEKWFNDYDFIVLATNLIEKGCKIYYNCNY
ncbi:MAG: hypothetical protein QM478_11555 [Flavobacteriaceae bacterium]